MSQNKNITFTKEMIYQVLDELAKVDHFFVSEVHLQTEFIIKAHELFPEYKYLPELVPSKVPAEYKELFGNKGVHFDLLILANDEKILVEFKYITKSYSEVINGLNVSVKSHAAHDIRRYDSWKDISRIESFVNSTESDVDAGYFILLTNDYGFWNKKDSDTQDAMFQLNNGRHEPESKAWKEGTPEGTKKGRSQAITIKNPYNFEYVPFYCPNQKNGIKNQFMSLVVKIL